MTRPLLRIGTRGSPLALAQAREARERLAAANPDLAAPEAVEIVTVRTTGDKVRDRRLAEIGGKGLFTKELEEALLAGRIDVAVHSLKDLPTWLPEGLAIAAVPPRADPRDVLVSAAGETLAELPRGAVFGTASLRRQAQALALRADLRVVPLRGNVDTRLRKLAEGTIGATMLALAGLKRLAREDVDYRVLEPDEILPAVGQGAIALELRAGDGATEALVRAVDDAPSARRVAAERACLEVLDGSCRTPIAGLAEIEEPSGELRLRALVAAPDGRRVYRAEGRAGVDEAERLGREVGAELRAAAGEAFFAALAARMES